MCAMGRVLARILEMAVQNSNRKIFARPDLATQRMQLLQILIPTIFSSLLYQKNRFHFSNFIGDGLWGKGLVINSNSSKLIPLYRVFTLMKRCFLTPMLMVANLANTTWSKNPEKWLKNPSTWVLIWVLSKSYPMNTNMTGFRWFSKIFASLCFGRK